MPFQPTPLKTNPVQLALSIREMRMKQQQAERQFQLDKIKAMGDAQSNAITNRKGEAEAAKAEFELMSALAERREAATAGFQSDQKSIVDKFRTDPNLQNVREGLDSNTEFGSIVQENDPRFVERNISEELIAPTDKAIQKRFGNVNAAIERLARAQAAMPGAEPIDAIRTRLHDALGVETATSQFQDDRAFQQREREQRADDSRQTTRDRRKLQDAIRTRDKALRAAINPRNSEAERDAALDQLTTFQGFINRQVNEGVSIGGTQDKEFIFTAATTISNAKALSNSIKAFIPELEANPSAAGLQATLSSFTAQSQEVFGDTLQWLEEQKAKNPDNKRLQAFDISEADLQSASDLGALGDLVALTVVRLNSPDRFAQSMFDRWAKRFNFGGAKSTGQVVRSMRTAASVLDNHIGNAENRLSPVVDSPFLNPVERLRIRSSLGEVETDQGQAIDQGRVGFPSIDMLREQRGALPVDSQSSSATPAISASDFMGLSREEKARILLGN